ncbi:unnamed protein product [Didymodactylos carnosus]|uniref:Uncharacterized protein n=1 Tax=Didymodactylos carnosus TaxID=1234261 RepID=A0A814AL06_9BILA|nr:unnamed protein product [Didymodactylos carnosus]CAF0914267.1 unnamed protein product [Didymodactylos carnosus]CAF3531002.1 unnamed protein product [Didymodactylos carnosus]CAF3694731.1 unnamed protein product [Didymodactylos carnosus]
MVCEQLISHNNRTRYCDNLFPNEDTEDNNRSCPSLDRRLKRDQNLERSILAKIQSNEFYHLPGYQGYIPQESYMSGYGKSEISRQVFRNPAINTKPEKLFSKVRYVRDGDAIREEERKNALEIRQRSFADRIYKPHIIVSGYTGHIPRFSEKFGKNVKDLFIDDFEDDQAVDRYAKQDFQLQKQFDKRQITEADLPNNSILHYAREAMPLIPINQNSEPYVSYEKDWTNSVYKMSNDDSDKRFISGLLIKDKPVIHDRHPIYPCHSGLTPQYMGDVPGLKFQFGGTYGSQTVNAKQHLLPKTYLLNPKKIRCYC